MRNPVISRRVVQAGAGLLAAASLGVLTACGSDDPAPPADDAGPGQTTTGESPDTAPLPTLLPPIPEELTAIANAAFGSDADPAQSAAAISGPAESNDTAAGNLAAENWTIEITDLYMPGAGTAEGTGVRSVDGTPETDRVTVEFVAEDGAWKLSRDWVCEQVDCG
ncbi:hypothetical protein G4H71_12935 [Rhodococcus triatomae]|uniref:Low molecular weight antigen MTB12-like C-terminal domain-containing protein n=1 Tax=Rhodococcus triatomae TaxID=300028 RepID=A0A1G8GWT0_9NOCA|nr:hypothetical protein [Rhodococcus triatomae]QNG20279.1 hypothetical protein G4H72_17445 [Rhodococcus triatomae]QNG23806.1 hypothetical protein G4H71_12935 [Rhodococcus triatomae]SDH98741.1 hypothetical protein SAMN05444695_104227 [Rhodococcus triatomae]